MKLIKILSLLYSTMFCPPLPASVAVLLSLMTTESYTARISLQIRVCECEKLFGHTGVSDTEL